MRYAVRAFFVILHRCCSLWVAHVSQYFAHFGRVVHILDEEHPNSVSTEEETKYIKYTAANVEAAAVDRCGGYGAVLLSKKMETSNL